MNKMEFCITPLPPWNYPEAKIWACTFTLKEEIPLPPGINKISPQIGSLTFASYEKTSIGPYDELLFFLMGEAEGRPAVFCPLVYVSTDEAFLGGRDVWGFPKRMGNFVFEKRGKITYGQLLKNGRCLVALELEEIEETKEVPYMDADHFVLKRIIDPTGVKEPIRQLIRMRPPMKWKTLIDAKVKNLNFYPTDLERVDLFEYKEILTGSIATLDMTFVFGEIYKEWEE